MITSQVHGTPIALIKPVTNVVGATIHLTHNQASDLIEALQAGRNAIDDIRRAGSGKPGNTLASETLDTLQLALQKALSE